MVVLPSGIITDWDISIMFKEPSAGVSIIGIILFAISFFVLRRKYKDEIKLLPNSHIGVYIYKQISGIMTFGTLALSLLFISSFTSQIWLIFLLYGVGYVIGTHFFYLAACIGKE